MTSFDAKLCKVGHGQGSASVMHTLLRSPK